MFPSQSRVGRKKCNAMQCHADLLTFICMANNMNKKQHETIYTFKHNQKKHETKNFIIVTETFQ